MRRFIDDNQDIEKELKEGVINAIPNVSDYVNKRKRSCQA